MFRAGAGRGGAAGREIARARSAERDSMVSGAKAVAKAKREFEEGLAEAEKDAFKRVAKARVEARQRVAKASKPPPPFVARIVFFEITVISFPFSCFLNFLTFI
jgi:hypothetical protein